MDAMNSPAKSKLSSVLKLVKQDFPDVYFASGEIFSWSAEERTIYFQPFAEDGIWLLFHELGHMKHEHNTYNSDARLVRMEVEAWESAKELARTYDFPIDDEFIEDCMDSYRSWQYLRSKCPTCSQAGMERSSGNYFCINCRNEWRVTDNRFCRAYRMKKPRT